MEHPAAVLLVVRVVAICVLKLFNPGRILFNILAFRLSPRHYPQVVSLFPGDLVGLDYAGWWLGRLLSAGSIPTAHHEAFAAD